MKSGLVRCCGHRPVFQFLFGVETLAARAVMPAVLAEIDVAVVVHLLEKRLHAGLVIGIRRTDELIVLDAELGPQGLELAADAVHEFLRGLPGRFGGLDDLVAVLVRAGQEPRILAEQRMETAPGCPQRWSYRRAQGAGGRSRNKSVS